MQTQPEAMSEPIQWPSVGGASIPSVHSAPGQGESAAFGIDLHSRVEPMNVTFDGNPVFPGAPRQILPDRGRGLFEPEDEPSDPVAESSMSPVERMLRAYQPNTVHYRTLSARDRRNVLLAKYGVLPLTHEIVVDPSELTPAGKEWPNFCSRSRSGIAERSRASG